MYEVHLWDAGTDAGIAILRWVLHNILISSPAPPPVEDQWNSSGVFL